MRDKSLVKQMEEAWKESNPDAAEVPRGQPGSLKVEQGGWIVEKKSFFWWLGIGESTYYLQRVPANSPDDPSRRHTIDALHFGMPDGAVGWFHTHPNTAAEGYVPEVFSSGWDGSGGDIGFTDFLQVPGVMRHPGGYVYVYPEPNP